MIDKKIEYGVKKLARLRHLRSALLKTEAAKLRKQRRTLKQTHEDLKELGFEGSYDRVAAFARTWREDQSEKVNPASKRTLTGIR